MLLLCRSIIHVLCINFNCYVIFSVALGWQSLSLLAWLLTFISILMGKYRWLHLNQFSICFSLLSPVVECDCFEFDIICLIWYTFFHYVKHICNCNFLCFCGDRRWCVKFFSKARSNSFCQEMNCFLWSFSMRSILANIYSDHMTYMWYCRCFSTFLLQ